MHLLQSARTGAWRRMAATLFSASLLVGMASATGQTLTDPNLSVLPVVAGLSQPTSMAFLGASDFLILEKASGRVKRVTNGAIAATVLDLAVNSSSQRGLLGIALDPNFASNQFVYLFWSESSTGADSSSFSDVPTPLGNRVDRFLWDAGANTLTYSANLIRLRASQNDKNNAFNPAAITPQANNNGGKLATGPDGKLYVFVGDVGRRGWLQNLVNGPYVTGAADDEFGGPAVDTNHLTGVVLRLNTDGSAPSDNPFFAAGVSLGGEMGANIQKIFSYGHRNSFGLAFDPVSGNLWASENGDDSFDEINKIVAGGNYGWAQFMGPISRIAQFKAIESNLFSTLTAKIGSLEQIRFPVTRIAYNATTAQSRMFSLPGATYRDPELSWRYGIPQSGLGFVNGNGLGTAYNGTLWGGEARPTDITGGATGTFAGGALFRMKLTVDRARLDLSADPRLADRVADNGVAYPPPFGTHPATAGYKFNGVESETLLIGQGFGVVTDIVTGPNGCLYVTSNSLGAVYAICEVRIP